MPSLTNITEIGYTAVSLSSYIPGYSSLSFAWVHSRIFASTHNQFAMPANDVDDDSSEVASVSGMSPEYGVERILTDLIEQEPDDPTGDPPRPFFTKKNSQVTFEV